MFPTQESLTIPFVRTAMSQFAHAVGEDTERSVFETCPDACTYARNDNPRILCQGQAPQGYQHDHSIADVVALQNRCDVFEASEPAYSDIYRPARKC